MSIVLSPRLSAVALCVPRGSRVIDVGTDHAMIPVWLAQTGKSAHIWASDVREGPLRSSAALIEKTGTGDRISLRLTDGLQGFGPEHGDTVIMAGMGGETMISILSAAPWVKNGVLLILEPQSKQAELRRYLAEAGFAIGSERLVQDGKRIYPILTAQGGRGDEYTPAEWYTGLFTQICDDPLFPEYLTALIRRAETAAPFDPAAEERRKALLEMERRLRSCRQ